MGLNFSVMYSKKKEQLKDEWRICNLFSPSNVAVGEHNFYWREKQNKTNKIIWFEKNILHSILINSVSYSQKPIYNVVAIFFL